MGLNQYNPIRQWNITETEFKKENNYRNETTLRCLATLAQEELSREAYPF